VAGPPDAGVLGRLVASTECPQDVSAHWAAIALYVRGGSGVPHHTVHGYSSPPTLHPPTLHPPTLPQPPTTLLLPPPTAHPVPRLSGHHPSGSHPAVRELKIATEAPGTGRRSIIGARALFEEALEACQTREREIRRDGWRSVYSFRRVAICWDNCAAGNDNDTQRLVLRGCNDPSVNSAQALIKDDIRAETIDGGYRFDFDADVEPA
ncbi:hypothetical protein L198_02151, partial [Cryptococcus wingfieldii CBS 7118]